MFVYKVAPLSPRSPDTGYLLTNIDDVFWGYIQVCATYADGFRATAVCPVGGPFASLKAKKTGEALLKR